MMMKIYRDFEGKCINIGEWDFMASKNDSGEEVVTNPLPEGAYEDHANVEVGYDGGLYVSESP